jgi:hypothetical protein
MVIYKTCIAQNTALFSNRVYVSKRATRLSLSLYIYIYIYVYYIQVIFGQLSRYSDWLRAGRSGDRMLVGARFSAPVQTGPGAHPASWIMGTRSFPGVESGRDVTLTPHPLLVPRSKNRVELYLYSP